MIGQFFGEEILKKLSKTGATSLQLAAGTGNMYLPQTSNSFIGGASNLVFDFSIPIVGWSNTPLKDL